MVTLVASQELATPKRIKMTYEEYLSFTTDAQIVEWAEGEAIVYMPPIYLHQLIISFLDKFVGGFVDYFNLGSFFPSPFEIKLWPGGPSREPDLIFISHAHSSGLKRERFIGGPDLVIEIVSPGSVTEDRVRKFTEYEQAGVREYWLIDPRSRKQQADFYTLGEDGRFHSEPIDDDGVFHSKILSGFWLNVDWLLAGDLPSAQTTLAEILLTHPDVSAEEKAAYKIILKSRPK